MKEPHSIVIRHIPTFFLSETYHLLEKMSFVCYRTEELESGT
jgi:hypothetical protein